jgi:predicted permease
MIHYLRALAARLRRFSGDRRANQELDDEMETHMRLLADRYVRQGMSEAEAAWAARRQFGNVTLLKEEHRDMRGIRFIDTLSRDLRYGIRMLVKTPGVTLIAIVTLALGIGANTAIFSVVNAVLLQPLPYPESERLVWFSEREKNFPTMSISYPNFIDYRAQQTVFENIGVYEYASYNLTGRGEPRLLQGTRASAEAFAALRVRARIGRIFSNDEDKVGAPFIVVLSYQSWQTLFGGDAGIINQPITLNGQAYTVIGVMSADFTFPTPMDFWMPLGQIADLPGYQARDNHSGLMGVARLKPRVTLEQARAEMDGIAARLEQQYPNSNKNVRVRIESLLDNYVSGSRWALWILLGAVGMVMLIACANVANLLLARAATRQREMAVRSALGASSWRIVRQLLTESILLAVMGAGLGLLLAQWGLPLILAVGGGAIPRASEIRLDLGVLAFTAALAVLTGILFGLAPAWQSSRLDVQGMLKDTARSVTGSRAMLRQVLVVAEVALTLILLIGAGLLLRSFHHLHQVNAGFTHEHVLSFKLDSPLRKYTTPEQQIAFYRSLLEKLESLPGVESVGFSSQLPLDGGDWQTGFWIEGRPAPPLGEGPSMEVTTASPDYFRTLGIPLLRGRCFTEQDNREHLRGSDLSRINPSQHWAAGLNTVIIDEEFVRRYWPNEDPIGKRIRLPWGSEPALQPLLTIVGVVSRVKIRRLNERSDFVQAYLPAFQATSEDAAVVIKTTGDPGAIAAAVRQQVLTTDPQQPVYDLRTLTQLRDNSLSPERLYLALLGSFAVVALLLAIIGLYGVISFAVTQRTHEIGIRIALGARSGNVLTLIVKQGMTLTLIGVVIGLAGSFGLTRLIESLLFGVSTDDPLTFAIIALLVAAASLLACMIPARRAARVDPMVALRRD